MNVTILDTKTGKRKDCSDWHDFDVYWWTQGNGSCDCNRFIAMGLEDDDNEEDDNVDCKCERFLIVDVSGDLEGRTREDILAESNEDYPRELVEHHMEATK
jgi:hypothetical protein